MTDKHFQTLVDREVACDDAPLNVRRVLRLMIDREIIEPSQSRCLPDPEAWGHRPGRNVASVVRSENDAVRNLHVNGVSVTIGRTIFDSGRGRLTPRCPDCRAANEPGAPWLDSLDEWFTRSGPGSLACSSCGGRNPVDLWIYEPPWAFGNLGFTFWNWPQLKVDFVIELAKLLGHKTRMISGIR